MKNIKIFCMLVVSALLLFSCFEDDGNYDYKDIYTHKIGIRYPVYGITVYQGDPVVFSPSFAFANQEQKESGDTNMYKWSYHFDYLGCVCTERNMNMVVADAEVGKTYEGIVMAEDTLTGAIYTQNISFRYKSRYTSGWIILSDDGGKSKLNLVRIQNEQWYTDKDIYRAIHNEELGTQPVGLIGNRSGRNDVRILQKGAEGNVILDGVNYQKIGTIADEFVGGKYPEGFVPKSMVVSGGNVAAIQGENGEVFTKVFDSWYGTPYEFALFANVPLQSNKQKLNVPFLLFASQGSSTYNLMLYDETFHAFFMMYGASFYYAGKLYKLKAPADWDGTNGPSPENLSNYKMVYCQMKNASYYTQDILAVLKNKTDGELYLYTFEYSSSSNNVTAKNIVYTRIPAVSAALMGENTKYHALRNRPYMFFVSETDPSTLYYYDLRTNRHAPFKTFSGSKIVALESDYSNHTHIGVGLDNGEFFLLNVEDEVLVSGTEEDKVIYNTIVDGKVVDLFYKQY
ncbi:PKD-like family lipoprotein [Sanguibacteroides justesenii]|nr:PKD-like family lipoprotein [Sanguibacteroides justesenii]